MISTSNLSELPDPTGFRLLTKSLAALDAIMSPDWESRYFSFDAKWAEDEMMTSMRNGEGDLWFSIICEHGVALHGLAHEFPDYTPDEPKPWVFRELPQQFRSCFLEEPAFDTANSTFCLWRLTTDRVWSCGSPDPRVLDGANDGSAYLLELLDGDPQRYVEFASRYYEREISQEDVERIYKHRPVTPDLVSRLNPEAVYEDVARELAEIGYPDAGLSRAKEVNMRTIRTFYCIAGLSNEVSSQGPVFLTEDTIYGDLLGHLSRDGDFLGVIDESGTALQVMYEAEDDAYWTEIPDPSAGGSHGRRLSFDEVTDLFKALPERFSTTTIAGLKFQSWS